jgi:hypothetical protein
MPKRIATPAHIQLFCRTRMLDRGASIVCFTVLGHVHAKLSTGQICRIVTAYQRLL